MTDQVDEMSAASRGSVANHSAFPNSWIPASERLPDEYEVVMVGWAGRRDIGKGYLLNGKWHDPLVCTPDVNPPTHWMPLPAPPRDGK
jgi:hypothetical protein